MNIHKQVTTTALLLMLFATIGAALVGVIYDNTHETIKYNEQQALLKQLNNIVPASKYDNEMLTDTLILAADHQLGTTESSIAYRARKQDKNIAVVFSAIAPNGYNGSIHLLVGVYNDGNLAGVRVVKHRETPGLGDAIDTKRSDWILDFDGKSLSNLSNKQWKVKRDGGEFDQFTGATITPRAVVKAVHSALLYFAANKEVLFKLKSRDKQPELKADKLEP
ncbi:MAG: electron transport complex subunit RsxG [Gammaproteobacteria bacterium]|nr:electron transport complex subunit RsxG [Gammaproteobacteria bacterium]MCK5262361.1 electron transport complex subunit RsxG [Gammaproteobacteria bacterium]